jgi:hypothetical protein
LFLEGPSRGGRLSIGRVCGVGRCAQSAQARCAFLLDRRLFGNCYALTWISSLGEAKQINSPLQQKIIKVGVARSPRHDLRAKYIDGNELVRKIMAR